MVRAALGWCRGARGPCPGIWAEVTTAASCSRAAGKSAEGAERCLFSVRGRAGSCRLWRRRCVRALGTEVGAVVDGGRVGVHVRIPGRGAFQVSLEWAGGQAGQTCADELGRTQKGQEVARGVVTGDVNTVGEGARCGPLR